MLKHGAVVFNKDPLTLSWLAELVIGGIFEQRPLHGGEVCFSRRQALWLADRGSVFVQFAGALEELVDLVGLPAGQIVLFAKPAPEGASSPGAAEEGYYWRRGRSGTYYMVKKGREAQAKPDPKGRQPGQQMPPPGQQPPPGMLPVQPPPRQKSPQEIASEKMAQKIAQVNKLSEAQQKPQNVNPLGNTPKEGVQPEPGKKPTPLDAPGRNLVAQIQAVLDRKDTSGAKLGSAVEQALGKASLKTAQAVWDTLLPQKIRDRTPRPEDAKGIGRALNKAISKNFDKFKSLQQEIGQQLRNMDPSSKAMQALDVLGKSADRALLLQKTGVSLKKEALKQVDELHKVVKTGSKSLESQRRLKDEVNSQIVKFNESTKELADHYSKSREALTQSLKAKDQADFHYTTASNMSPGQKQAINEGLAFVKSILEAKGMPPIKIDFVSHERSSYKRPSAGSGRPNHTIRLSKDADASHVVHELGHLIEETLADKGTVNEFLKHRVGDEPFKDMAEFGMPGEKGRQDHFDRALPKSVANYVGKVYKTGETEVISVGLETLFRQPDYFAAKDPEYAKMICGLLSGKFRKREK